MTYVNLEDYTSYKGESADSADFSLLCSIAEQMIEEMTVYRLSEESFAKMPENIRERVKKAVCAQIEYIENSGGMETLNEPGNIQSASLGKFSFSEATTDNTGKASYSPIAVSFLRPTGLMYRGGRC